jgi:hypothetical protein
MLAGEFDAIDSRAAKLLPKLRFGGCRISSEIAGAGNIMLIGPAQ